MMAAQAGKQSWGRRLLRALLWLALAFALLLGGVVAYNWTLVQRLFLGGLKVYETSAPALPADLKRPAILVFSKTNGFRHEEAIPAANRALEQMASDSGWGYVQTENGATFTPGNLARFDAVVFNNVSGDVFTPDQKAAFKAFVEGGGGYVGIHAAGDSSHTWDWFARNLIGAHFIGHPMRPQFQKATVRIEDGGHPATAGLPRQWSHTDEWYSFASSPRARGFHILATLDEASYSPRGLFGGDLAMGRDHPIAWWNCAGKGRVFYTAIGHTAESYGEPVGRHMLLGAVKWALDGEGNACRGGAR